jgi:hypothetical protein
LGDKDLYPWYASQWTPLFLLDEGGSTVTQFISEISGLNVLQDAISLSLKNKRKALDDLRTAQSETIQIELRLNKLTKLDDLGEITKELERQAESIAGYERRITRGKELNESVLELSSKISKLKDVETVRISDGNMEDQISIILSMKTRLEKLEVAAKAVIAMRGKITSLPEVPQKEYNIWEKIKRFEGIDSLEQSVQALDPIKSVSIPDAIDPKLSEELNTAYQYERQISRLRKSVEKLETPVPLPSDFKETSELESLTRVKSAASEIKHLEKDIMELGREKAKIESELGDIVKELGYIPSCPTCSRPIISPHNHV